MPSKKSSTDTSNSKDTQIVSQPVMEDVLVVFYNPAPVWEEGITVPTRDITPWVAFIPQLALCVPIRDRSGNPVMDYLNRPAATQYINNVLLAYALGVKIETVDVPKPSTAGLGLLIPTVAQLPHKV